MAAITLYKDKINGVGSLLDDIIKSSNNLNAQLGTLKNTLQGVDSSTCNLQDTVDSISSSSKSESDKVEDLKKLNDKLTDFIEMTTRRDASAKSEIERAKEDFYTKYKYLKPECEKSTWEHICDGLKSACEWCKENWKVIVAVVLIVAAIVVVVVTAGTALGPIAGILAATAKGILIGAAIGGAIGGLSGYSQNGVKGILPGIINGASDGAIMGAAFGAIGGAGALAGEFFGCSAFMEGLFSVSSKLSLGMLGFDGLALINDFQTRFQMDTGINLGLIGPNFGGFISDLNQKAHSNPFYNTLQLFAGGAAAFSGGYVRTAACFIAGTLVATLDGFKAIEDIKAGDWVLSADANTMQTGYKQVLETYIRKVNKLVHLTINGETIVSTVDHPFYVRGVGFVNAANLCIGFKLVNNKDDILCVEEMFREELHGESVKVFNFQVEDYHTYFVGKNIIWVHNATCTPENRQAIKEHLDGTAENAGAKSNGMIDGCHEESVFLDELIASGGDLVGVTPFEGIKGVNVVKYKTAFKKIKIKTTYDSNIISTEEYINRGMEALNKVPGELSDISNGMQTAPDNSGVNWNIYIRTITQLLFTQYHKELLKDESIV